MNTTLRKILQPFASLRLTVALLAMLMMLIFASTLAQVDEGIWTIVHDYYRSFFVVIHFADFFPRDWNVSGGFYFPGGLLIGGLMLINLIAAHTLRFKLTAQRSGVILIHLALLVFLVGEGITGYFAIESQMPIYEGQTVAWSHDIREVELAVVDHSPETTDRVTAIPQTLLAQAARSGEPITHDALPFEVHIDGFMRNSIVRPIGQMTHATPASTHGIGARHMVEAAPAASGVESGTDLPSAIVTLVRDGQTLGNYLVSVHLQIDDWVFAEQPVQVDGRTYWISLRFRRYYKPYTITLNEFQHNTYTGTQVAKDFSSYVDFSDPTRSEYRSNLRIWMNHPFRYRGETFFQANWIRPARGTVFQVVDNPAWQLPYVAFVLAGIGLAVHFGIKLARYLMRLRIDSPAEPLGMPGAIATAAAVFIAVAYLASQARLPADTGQMRVSQLAQYPVGYGGRHLPLDSVARNTLLMLSHRSTLTRADPTTGDEVKVPAAVWLADLMARPDRADADPVFRIDHPDVAELVGLADLDRPRRRYSYDEMRADLPRLMETAGHAAGQPQRQRSVYQSSVLDLATRVRKYEALRHDRQADAMELFAVAPELQDEFSLPAREGRYAMNDLAPALGPMLRAEAALLDGRGADDTWSARDMALVKALQDVRSFIAMAGPSDMLLLPPSAHFPKGAKLREAFEHMQQAGHMEPGFADIVDTLLAYRAGDAELFNQNLARLFDAANKADEVYVVKAKWETFFNQFAPFHRAMLLYVVAALVLFAGVIGWGRQMFTMALALIIVALVVHTFGLILRIYLSGRPPVTNLYSSAVFIGWGVAVLGLAFEYFMRNGLALFVVAVSGALTLLVAAGLAVDGDTMAVLQAVLDTNFWLATHVVVITLGYAATFMAGALGMIYIVLAVGVPGFDRSFSRQLGAVIYGVLCFAIVFSFVGTVLGGIWADQSWGRFWGWDPKENGALLIVLMTAVALHARWAGMVRERGLAVLAVMGNIVTCWSWFGTNMLGVGLHSYGFMDSAVFWLLLFVGINLLFIAVGLLPRWCWLSDLREARPGAPGPAPAQKPQAKVTTEGAG